MNEVAAPPLPTDPSGLPDATDEGLVPHGHSGDHPREGLAKLALGAVGIVFGDIGTSPIYAFRETFAGHHPLAPTHFNVLGVLSLIFWSMIVVVTVKYVAIIMRADNKGEGGSLALLALVSRSAHGTRRWSRGLMLLGVFATALFFGDSMVTPAMSVLSAVEGLVTVEPGSGALVLPLAIGILIGLFMLQARGTARVGLLFGPIMVVYFVTIAVLGVAHLVRLPWVLTALSPHHALVFFADEPARAFLALGSVVLAVTGAEALYADMGHFGRRPIRLSWLWFVLPALMLNYLGQGALLLAAPPAQAMTIARSPFFLLAPDTLRLPLVVLATAATVIASQAVISGAFSVAQQAVQLGFMPRLKITHTSAHAAGQIYVPAINWTLMVMVIVLVLGFRTSSNLAAVYGIAVTGAMLIDTFLLATVVVLWRWNRLLALGLIALFGLFDGTYFLANLLKVPDGGWAPLLVALIGFTLLTTWARGRQLMISRLNEAAMPIPIFVRSAAGSVERVPGTAVFMTTAKNGIPHALLHNLKHNKILHERVILLTVRIEDVPYVSQARRIEAKSFGQGFYRMVVHYGFMQEPDVPAALSGVTDCGPPLRMMDTSFFLARQTLIPSEKPGMAIWREKLFSWMLRNAESAMEFFRLPSNRVVELGSQVEI